MKYLLAILFFGALVAIYIVLYLMNKKTPKPEAVSYTHLDVYKRQE